MEENEERKSQEQGMERTEELVVENLSSDKIRQYGNGRSLRHGARAEQAMLRRIT